MKVNLEKEANNIVKLDIEVPAKDAVNEYNKAAKKISEYVNIPGFRKGKAPRNLVEQHVGTEKIKQEALERLLPNIFKETILENKLDVIAQPYVESYDFEIGKDIKIVAKVELRPEVKLGGYKNLTVDVKEYETPKDAFDKALDNLLQRNATFSLVVDRPTKETDVVITDFDGSVKGEKIQGGAAQNYSLDLANSNFIPGFAEQLVGKKLNDEFDINVQFPKEYQDEKLAGHSLGEFSALVANGALSFEDGLKLVSQRALAMQKACEITPSTMAAVLNLEDKIVEDICGSIDGVVVAANYNCPGQLVISGEYKAVELACEKMKEAGAKRALILPVGGAFHSPMMEPAREELAAAIEATTFSTPICPVYQNVTASAVSDPAEIKKNLIIQLTAPVKWTQSVQQMIQDGATSFTEVGPGKVLAGLIGKIDKEAVTANA